MAVHDEVLAAAIRIAGDADWTFTPDQIVRALPHLNARTIRTHVTSRCCVNAPKNHPHKWNYFRRVGRGTYSIVPAYRIRTRAASRVAEPTASMVVDVGGGTSEVAVISLGGIVVARSLRVGGHDLDDAIAAFIQREHSLAVGEQSSEEIKLALGSAMEARPESVPVRGRDLVSGLPKRVELTGEEIRKALEVQKKLRRGVA